MGNKFFSFLDSISTLIQIYLNSISNAEKVETEAKHSLINIILLTTIGGAILLSSWISVLVLIFFALLSYGLTYIQVAAIIVAINSILIIGLIIAFFKTAKKVKQLKNKSFMMLLNYLIVIVREICQK